MTEDQLELGKWWSQYRWDHFVTLTVDPRKAKQVGRAGRCPRSLSGVGRAMLNEFHRQCTKVVGGPVPNVWVLGLGAAGDNPHAHGLLAATGAISCERMQGWWRHGLAAVEPYDPARGAAYYLAKHVGTTPMEWQIGKAMPPRLRVA